jgi:deoxycytidylate deaminase
MSSTDPLPSTDQRPELMIALVGAIGTPLDKLSQQLKQRLKGNGGYTIIDIHLSDLLKNFKGWKDQTERGEYDRIRHRQDMGTAFRKQLRRGDALALAGIAQIRAERTKFSGSPDKPAPAHAYILHQLKHPDEVDLLRRIYGICFQLTAGHSTIFQRKANLKRQMAQPSKAGKEEDFDAKASEVIRIDEKEDDDYGQNVRDTYPEADFFINLGIDKGEYEVPRFVDLLFGHPFRTPSPDEYAMYLANAVSLGSSDYNRQVGSVIVRLTPDPLYPTRNRNTDIIAVGMNEVPCARGGPYCDQDSPDLRDQNLLQQDVDRAAEIKRGVLTELIEKIVQKKWLHEAIGKETPSDLADGLWKELKGTQFLDIGEFSRPVHAEMAALIDAARRGVAVDGHSMYVTAFPCHNCTKHIIAAGIKRVIYLEPYPKSRARSLYGEEVFIESLDGMQEEGKAVEGKVVLVAFTGIAPRQYQRLFSMSERGAKKGKQLKRWEEDQLNHTLSPLYVPQNASLLYLAAERQALENLPTEIYRWDKKALCPTHAAP